MRNKHHFEYWLDFKDFSDFSSIYARKIPYKYVIEMFCDMISTGKVYYKENWTCSSPLEFYLDNALGKRIVHIDSELLLLKLLFKLHHIGDEKLFIKWYRKNRKSLMKEYNYNKEKI